MVDLIVDKSREQWQKRVGNYSGSAARLSHRNIDDEEWPPGTMDMKMIDRAFLALTGIDQECRVRVPCLPIGQ